MFTSVFYPIKSGEVVLQCIVFYYFLVYESNVPIHKAYHEMQRETMLVIYVSNCDVHDELMTN